MKKLLSLLLILTLCLGLLPLSATADDGQALPSNFPTIDIGDFINADAQARIVVGGVTFCGDNNISFIGGDDDNDAPVSTGTRALPGYGKTVYEKEGDPEHSTWWITNAARVIPSGSGSGIRNSYILTLNNATITGKSDDSNLYANVNLAIQLAEGSENTIGSNPGNTTYAMQCTGSLVIYGKGKLTATSGYAALAKASSRTLTSTPTYLDVTVRDGAQVNFISTGEYVSTPAVSARNLCVVDAQVSATSISNNCPSAISLITLQERNDSGQAPWVETDGGLVLMGDAVVEAQAANKAMNLTSAGSIYLMEERKVIKSGDSNEEAAETQERRDVLGQRYVYLETQTDPYGLYVNGVKVSAENAEDVLGTADGNNASVQFTPADPENGKPAKLTLTDAKLTTPLSFLGEFIAVPLTDAPRPASPPAQTPSATMKDSMPYSGVIHSELSQPLVIELNGSNLIEVSSSVSGSSNPFAAATAGIVSACAPVTIRGEQSSPSLETLDPNELDLLIDGAMMGVIAPSIAVENASLVTEGCTVGLRGLDSLTVSGSAVWTLSRFAGLSSYLDVTIADSEVAAMLVPTDTQSASAGVFDTAAIMAQRTLTIRGAKTRVVADAEAYARTQNDVLIGVDPEDVIIPAFLATNITIQSPLKVTVPQNGKVGPYTYSSGENVAVISIDGDSSSIEPIKTIVDPANENKPATRVEIRAGSTPIYYYEESYPITVTQPQHAVLSASAQQAAPGATVTVAVDADEGWHASTITVRDASGALVDATPTDNGAVFRMPSSAVTVSALIRADDLPFGDVSESNWFYRAVKFCYEIGAISGVTEDSFAPDQLMSRAMFATVLYNLAGRPSVTGENPFPDVPEGRWFTTPIIWASQNGIIYGYEDGTFGPNNPVTREQMVTQFWRTLGQPEATVDLSAFSDADTINSWARPAMEWAVSVGVIAGKDGRLDPQGKATRAEAAQIVMQVETLT